MTKPNLKLSTGILGLDEILHGGLLASQCYLVAGGPGSGKTTLGLHFLRADFDETCLFVTLGESESQLRSNAEAIGLSLDGVHVLDLSTGVTEEDGEPYSLLESWDVEGSVIHDRIVGRVRELNPTRVFIDSISHIRYLLTEPFQYRRQVMSLLRKLTLHGATVLFTSEELEGDEDETLNFLGDGVIKLTANDYGRLCRIQKYRGSGFAAGHHFCTLSSVGLTLYPRLIPGEHSRNFKLESIRSGVPELDQMTHGGIERGTVTLVSGPTGVGKTTLAAQYMKEAASRGERSVIYNFDEGPSTFFHRCESIGLPIREMVAGGNLSFEAIEPLHYSPDQFSALVRKEVEERNAKIVLLDSLSGYRQSVRGEALQERVHALCRYLVNMGVTVILISETLSVTGDQTKVTEDEVSYLADTIILIRYMELSGEIRKAISVLKKRTGDFEKALREFEISSYGLKVGRPLTQLRGILSGVPEFVRPYQE